MPAPLAQAMARSGSKTSSTYSQDEPVTANTNHTQATGSRFAEDLPESSRPGFPEVSQASHTAVKDAPIDTHPNAASQVPTGTSNSAAKSFLESESGTRDSRISNRPISGYTDGLGETESITSNLAALDIARAQAGAPFEVTGIPEDSTIDLPAVGPTDALIRRPSTQRSLAESIPMPTNYLQAITGHVPGGWNDPENHVQNRSGTTTPQARQESSTSRVPAPTVQEQASIPAAVSSEDRERAEHEADLRNSQQEPAAPEEDLSPEEYYKRARQQFDRTASFNSIQKTELAMVPPDTVRVSRSALEEAEASLSSKAPRSSSPLEKRNSTISSSTPVVAEMDRTDSQQKRQTRFTDGSDEKKNRSSASLRNEKSNDGYGQMAAAGLVGAGAGAYATHRSDRDDRGYSAAANTYQPSQPMQYQQQPQYQASPPHQYVQQGVPINGSAPAMMSYQDSGYRPQMHNNHESRRSNIFDNMSGVPGKFTSMSAAKQVANTSLRSHYSIQPV
jgi:hypothetical protein